MYHPDMFINAVSVSSKMNKCFSNTTFKINFAMHYYILIKISVLVLKVLFLKWYRKSPLSISNYNQKWNVGFLVFRS